MSALVPNHIHFVWFGQELPFFAQLAMRSATQHCPGATTTLWHDGSLTAASSGDVPGVLLREIDVPELLAQAVTRGDIDAEVSRRVEDVWHALEQPAARSNVVRLLVMLLEGGVYLDSDTLTLRDLADLRAHGAFVGLEHILWPKHRLEGSLRGRIFASLLSVARGLCAGISGGYRLHRRLLPFYETAANNAVLAFSPGHPFLRAALERIASLPESQWRVRFRLGTHLVQELLDSEHGAQVTTMSPEHFYPLGPVISKHYFRPVSSPAEAFAKIQTRATHVIHWYASVSELQSLDAAHIRDRASETIYAHLTREYVAS